MHEVVTHESGEELADLGARINRAIRRSKVVHVRGVDAAQDLRAYYDALSETVGGCDALAEDARQDRRSGAKWFELRYDPAVKNAHRHSCEAHPLHTDGSYIPNCPPVTMLYCVNAAPRGGESIFIDSTDFVDLVAERAAERLEQLRSLPMRFAKVGDEQTRPIVTQDDEGVVLTWNYYAVAPGQADDVVDLQRWLFGFQQDVVLASPKLLSVRLQPREAVLFQDQRLLHGRHGFDAYERSDRLLWKCFLTPHA